MRTLINVEQHAHALNPILCLVCVSPIKHDPSFAERINEDLTVFYSRDDRSKVTSLQIKNVEHILHKVQALKIDDAPGLNVLILPNLRRTERDHQEVVTDQLNR